MSEDVSCTDIPHTLSSPAEPATSASPATSDPHSPETVAAQTVQHEVDSAQYDCSRQANIEIAWEGDAGSPARLPAQAAAAAVASFISPDVSQFSKHQLPSLSILITTMMSALCVGVSVAVQGLQARAAAAASGVTAQERSASTP